MQSRPVLVFDLGKVVVDFNHQRATCALARHSPFDASRIHQVLFAHPTELDHSQGLISSTTFYTFACELLQLSLSFSEFARLWSDIFTERPLMTQLLANLRERYMLILCSNTDPLHIAWIRSHYHFLESFHAQIYSYEVHSLKPEAGIYEAVEQASTQPATAHLFMDDIPKNVEAALARGWDAFVVSSVPQLLTELQQRGIRCQAEPLKCKT